MNRSAARIFSPRRSVAVLLCAICGVLAQAAAPAHADPGTDYWFGGTRLIFEAPQMRGGALAVPTGDSGLARFLGVTGATLAYQPGQKYVVVTSADRRVVAFTLGATRYTIAGVAQTAPFAPYADGDAVYLPFAALASALYVDALPDGDETVLQPEIGSLDVRSEGPATVVTLRAAAPLRFKRMSAAGDARVKLSFAGVGSTLAHERNVAASALAEITIATGGTAKNPSTTIAFDAPPGSTHALLPSPYGNALAMEFAPAGVALRGSPLPLHGETSVSVTGGGAQSAMHGRSAPALASAPREIQTSPSPAPLPSGQPLLPENSGVPESSPFASAAPSLGAPVAVTALTSAPTSDGGFEMHISLSGNVSYEWHRLADDRWYVDLKPATLTAAPEDESLHDSTVKSLRVKNFVGPHDQQPTVRIAFTLNSPRVVNLLATPAGATVAISPVDDDNPQLSGYGQLTDGRLVVASAPTALPPPPVAEPVPIPTGTWKFAPAPPSNGSRIIVIDPGHGGSDPGAEHNGLVEKDLTLAMARRLRDVLVARGWIVKMTRDSDIDVYQPNDSGRDELQARDDIANNLHARLLISVHGNANSYGGVSGTTTYYYKGDSYAFARAVHARLAADLPTKDDGILKDKFYVIAHTTMPAILIETAFLTNPGDAALLRDPAFQQKIALAIAEGVGDFTSTPHAVSQAPSADGGR